ncbi:hypothetical protein ACTFR8_23045 [Bacillus cereus group sp. MYBK15-3]|uniref:hypothetical protein n=1 Tax=unclassified Bacillus cereus group TaxID=2750818 RepID=UPI003F7A6194
MREKCERCGGSGRLFLKTGSKMEKVKCPVCKGKKTIATEDDIIVEDRKSLEKLFEEYIPNEYFRFDNYNRKKLEKGMVIPPSLRDVTVETYFEFIDIMLATLLMGGIPRKSYMVSAPDMMGKKWFAYTAIKNLLRAGLKPTKLLDSKDLYELLEKRQFGELKKELTGDVAFLTLGGSPSRADIVVLKEAVDICERMGTPMFVISRTDGAYLARYDAFLADAIGVKATKEGDLGRLEQQGIYGATAMNIRNHLAQTRG